MIGKTLWRRRASSGSSARVDALEARRLLSDVYAIQLVSGAGTKGSSGAAHTGSLSVDLQHDANRDGWAMVRAASPQAAVQAAITGVITVDTSPQGVRDWIRKRSGDKNFAGRQDTYDFDSNTHNAFRISGDGRKISLEDVASFPSGVNDADYNDRYWTVRLHKLTASGLTLIDKANSRNKSVNPSDADLYVAEPPPGSALFGRADVFIDPAGSADSSITRRFISWQISGDGIEGVWTGGGAEVGSATGTTVTGTFSSGNITARFRPNASGNRSFSISIGMDVDEDGKLSGDEIQRTSVVHVVKGELAVSHPVLTLLDTNTLTSTFHQGSGTATPDGFKYEVRFANQSKWYDMTSRDTNPADADIWTGKAYVAGKFKVRVTANVGGAKVASAERDVEQQFPEQAQIRLETSVRSAMVASWLHSKNWSNHDPEHRRREEGFWIKLNTATEQYEMTATHYGKAVSRNTAQVALDGFRKPADSHRRPSPLERPTYVVAWFHTHPTQAFTNHARYVGPSTSANSSGGDEAFSLYTGIPGFAYDYLPSLSGVAIPAYHPLHSAADVWDVPGLARRATP